MIFLKKMQLINLRTIKAESALVALAPILMLKTYYIKFVPGSGQSLQIGPDLTLSDQAGEAVIGHVQNTHRSAPVHGHGSMAEVITGSQIAVKVGGRRVWKQRLVTLRAVGCRV